MAAPANKKRPDGQQTREAMPLTVRAAVRPSSVNVEARTVEVTWSTGAEVDRYDWRTGSYYVEALAMAPKNVRLKRLNDGAPVLDSHSAYEVSSVLGVVESARMEDGEGVAVLRFSEREAVEHVWKDVCAGILRNLSVGYAVHKWEVTAATGGKREKRLAIDWEPYELSLVPIPADSGAQVRAHEDELLARGAEETTMSNQNTETPPANVEQGGARAALIELPAGPTPEEAARAAVVAERQRSSSIVELARTHGITDEVRDGWIASGATTNAVRDAILAQIGERQRATHVSPATLAGGPRDANMIRDAADCLIHRAGEKVEGQGFRNFGDGDLMQMARDVLSAGGVNVRTMSKNDIAKRALSTSDFSDIINLVGVKVMRAGYESVPLVHRAIFRKTTASDFRAKNIISIEGGQALEEVPEGSPIPRRKFSKEKTSYALKTYGGIIPVTRQLIINDDFDGIGKLSRQRGEAAAETERQVFWAYVLSNPDAADGTDCFHTDHANIDTATTGAGVTAVTLATARRKMRNQTSVDGVQKNIELAYVVCGTATETAWDQLLNGLYVPTSASTAMTARLRSVQLHVEPLVSVEDWYGFGRNNTFEFAYLSGEEGPRLESRTGFDVEGIELKVAMEFGCGLDDYRSCYFNNNNAT